MRKFRLAQNRATQRPTGDDLDAEAAGSQDRYDYVPINPVARLHAWPDDKRLAVYFCNGISNTLPSDRALGSNSTRWTRDYRRRQRNYAWRDYGNRVGLWRMFEFFDELELPWAQSIRCTTTTRRSSSGSASAATKSGHGRTNSEEQDDLWEDDEARLSASHRDDREARRRAAAGWMSPGSPKPVTPDLLKEAGYLYVMDWPIDDQPIWMRTRAGRSSPCPIRRDQRHGGFIHRQHTAASSPTCWSTSSTRCSISASATAGVQVSIHPSYSAIRSGCGRCAMRSNTAPSTSTGPGLVHPRGRDREILLLASGPASFRAAQKSNKPQSLRPTKLAGRRPTRSSADRRPLRA